MMKRCYISVDTEGSVGFDHGLIALPPDADMVSLGACVIGAPWRTFYAELNPVNGNWNAGAELIHRLSQDHLRRHGEDPLRIMTSFHWWTMSVAEGAIPVFCALPLAYDWEMVKWYFNHFGVDNPFSETLDGKDLYRRVKGLERHEQVTGAMIKEDFPTALPHPHHALKDALEQGDRFHQMLKVGGFIS